jgi:hypothetical protein
MPISLNVNRPKLVGTVVVPTDVIAKPVTEVSGGFEIPICFDNLASTPVALSDISFTTGGDTVTGLAEELVDVKIGSILVTAGDTADFTAGTYVTAKPTTTTLTVSTNALQTQANTTGTATLTIDATACILRVVPIVTGNNVRLEVTAARFTGTTATDSNGNGYDEVAYSTGEIQTLSGVTIDFDRFATNFGLERVNS